MGNKIEKFIKFRINLFKFVMVFLVSGGLVALINGLCQIFIPNNQPDALQVFLVIIGVMTVFFGLAFFLCLPVFFIWWLMVRKDAPKLTAVEKKAAKIKFLIGLGFAVLTVIFIIIVNSQHLGAQKCDNSECFLAAAGKCDSVKWQTTDKAGMTWSFYSSPYCRFEKELLTITGNESEGMKKVLEGQGLSCDYKQNKFDQLWVNSLIFDLEPCQGELKESIARLLLLL